MEQQFKYFAFISYNSQDTEWGKKIQRKLEHYRMPATLCSEHGWDRTPIKPVFFAPTDIQPGGLTEELQERLRASRNLIAICSPNSAKSEWVGKEIKFFHQLGRTKQIHFFIVDGIPHSGNPDTECFNPIVNTLGLPEILGANVNERTQTYPFTKISWAWLDKERAYVQLISKLLGVEFDAIWQRHKRQLTEKLIAWTIGVIAILTTIIGVLITNQPIEVEMRLNEISTHNDNLPPLKDAVVTMTLENESKTDTIHSFNNRITFANIPHRFLGKEVRIVVECKDFWPTDTIVTLNKELKVNIRRDETVYGTIHFTLWHLDKEVPVPNTPISIGAIKTKSDDNGIVRLFIPLESQDTIYSLHSTIGLSDTVIYVPHTEDAVVLVK